MKAPHPMSVLAVPTPVAVMKPTGGKQRLDDSQGHLRGGGGRKRRIGHDHRRVAVDKSGSVRAGEGHQICIKSGDFFPGEGVKGQLDSLSWQLRSKQQSRL